MKTQIHGILDYVTVIFLLISPMLFGMKDGAAVFTVALATVHFILTVFTNFSLGVFKVIPFKIHGLIEIIVAVALTVVAFLFKTSGDNASFYFYLGFSVVLFCVWLLSDYNAAPHQVINEETEERMLS